jgi:hypothetical protein
MREAGEEEDDNKFSLLRGEELSGREYIKR